MRGVAVAGLGMLALLTGAADSRSDRDFAEAVAGRVAEAPKDCLRVDQLQTPQVIDSRTIAYQDGRRLWVNQLAAACPGLDWNTIVVNEVFNGQLCKGDMFKTLDRGTRIPGPSCRYGAFTPWVKVARAR